MVDRGQTASSLSKRVRREYMLALCACGRLVNKLQNGLVLVLADMVKSRGKCSCDHVRKNAPYADIILRKPKKEGVYLDPLTDEFMADAVNFAPLHDAGKIQVSDAIRNKPGKLNDEEFECMKAHTTAGAEVISRAMDMVSEDKSGYLKKARNPAYFHHKKWNGTGYPCGLKGEEIPLSAHHGRSRRVRCAGLQAQPQGRLLLREGHGDHPREGSGNHFDPKAVDAFFHAREEVQQVMNTHIGP